MGALVLAGLVLLAGCATVPSRGERAVGQGERVFVTLRTDFVPVQVSAAEFTAAVTSLVLDMPLRVAPSQVPMRPGRRYAWASEPLTGGGWQSELARSYGSFCERRGTSGDCLSLFEDGFQFQDDDKRRIALALAVGPALESVDAEVSAMLSPARVAAMVSLSITAYMALLVAPEPVCRCGGRDGHRLGERGRPPCRPASPGDDHGRTGLILHEHLQGLVITSRLDESPGLRGQRQAVASHRRADARECREVWSRGPSQYGERDCGRRESA